MTSTMSSVTPATPRGRIWTGRILTAIAILFLLMDAIVKFIKPAPVTEAFAHLGYPIETAFGLGLVLLLCTVTYAVPSTSVLGATLLTGYLGGAVATHIRVGDPLFSHSLFPIYLGVMLWAGLYLRDGRLRSLLPIRH